MIKLGRLHFRQDSPDRGRVGEIGIVQKQAFFIDRRILIQAFQSRSGQCAGPSDKAVNFVAFLQKQFGEVRTVLAGDAGDESDWRGQATRI